MNPRPDSITRLDYCQSLLSSQINYTLTNFAEHSAHFSHDAINRYWADDQITPRLVWENVQASVVQVDDGYLVFDDTVLDKDFSQRIELVRRQYSGNAPGLIQGSGVVTWVYVNPVTEQFGIIDYRIYDPDGDGKSQLEHVRDRLANAVYHKQLRFRGVLMDTWYATQDLMLDVDQLHKVFYCPLKDNRQVDDSADQQPDPRVDSLHWTADDLVHGKVIKVKGFPQDYQVKLFRVVLSTQRTDYVVTNDGAQDDPADTQQVCGWRWKIEPFHRETKHLTGLESCQCRKARIVRNHIGCAILVWVRLKQVAADTQRTIYQVKHELLSDYLRQQLKTPTVKMVLA